MSQLLILLSSNRFKQPSLRQPICTNKKCSFWLRIIAMFLHPRMIKNALQLAGVFLLSSIDSQVINQRPILKLVVTGFGLLLLVQPTLMNNI